ncbi:MAG: phosphoesterase [Legionellales bacterium]|nr:phosphoesterase [Legionellales bacterium]|tara:strand:- start:794 stop:1054 length:261 start_codon:yes stop_codon:yes gene_type:complete
MVAKFQGVASWRDSARRPRLWIFDAYATFPLLLLLFHMSWFTFGIAITVMVFLKGIDYYGFNLVVFARWIKTTLAGPRKIATPWWL